MTFKKLLQPTNYKITIWKNSKYKYTSKFSGDNRPKQSRNLYTIIVNKIYSVMEKGMLVQKEEKSFKFDCI